MKAIKITILSTILIIAFGCNFDFREKLPESQIKPNAKNLNLMIVPDLSNRLDTTKYSKPFHDTELTAVILNNYFPKIFRSKGRLINQEDNISTIFPSIQNIIDYKINLEDLNIDLSKDYFSNATRIAYLEETDSIQKFSKDRKRFIKELSRVYSMASKDSNGSDIFALFKSLRLDSTKRNVMVLFTDGYIEYGIKGRKFKKGKKAPYLYKEDVDDFRNAYLKSTDTTIKSFFEANDYGIIPIENKGLKTLEVLVFEFYDRSSSETGNTRAFPNDYEILKLFWDDWLDKSGVKRKSIYKCVADKKEFKQIFQNFILSDY